MTVVLALAAIADRPADAGFITFIPPTVQDGAVETTIGNHLHAAGSARFIRSARVIEPHVYPLDQHPRYLHVVVLQENDSVSYLFVLGKVEEVLNNMLATVVAGVGFAADHDLNGVFGMSQKILQTLPIFDHERTSFIRGKPTGETEGEDPRIQQWSGTKIGLLRVLSQAIAHKPD